MSQGHSDTIAVIFGSVLHIISVRSGLKPPSFYCSWFCGSGVQAGLSERVCPCFTQGCLDPFMQLHSGVGWAGLEDPRWPRCLLSAGPRLFSFWPLLKRLPYGFPSSGVPVYLVSLQQDSLGFFTWCFRFARLKIEITRSLKVWVWKSRTFPLQHSADHRKSTDHPRFKVWGNRLPFWREK